MSNFNDILEEQLDLFDYFKDTVNESINDLLIDKLKHNDEKLNYEDLSFYPTYTRDKSTKIFMNSNKEKVFVKTVY